jgi:hypothetical protein
MGATENNVAQEVHKYAVEDFTPHRDPGGLCDFISTFLPLEQREEELGEWITSGAITQRHRLLHAEVTTRKQSS